MQHLQNLPLSDHSDENNLLLQKDVDLFPNEKNINRHGTYPVSQNPQDELQTIIICQKIRDEIYGLERDRSEYNLFVYSTEAQINILNRLLQLITVPDSFSEEYRKKYQLNTNEPDLARIVNALMQDKQYSNGNKKLVSNEEVFKSPYSIFGFPQKNTFIENLVRDHGEMKLKQFPDVEIHDESSKIEIDEVVVFGDSLTDENLMRLSAMGDWSGLKGNTPNGAFTNGYTWIGHLNMEVLEKAAIRSIKKFLGPHASTRDINDFYQNNVELIHEQITSKLLHDKNRNIFTINGEVVSRSYAIGGATAYDYKGWPSKDITRFITRLIVSRLSDQREQFLQDQGSIPPAVKKKKLIVQWIGANDLITVNENPSMLEADRVVEAEIENIKKLIENGFTNFRIGNLPDLSLTPRYQLDKTEAERSNARLCTEYLNRQLQMRVDELTRMHPDCNIKVIDVNAKYKACIDTIKKGDKDGIYKKYIDKHYEIVKSDVLPPEHEVAQNKFYTSLDLKNRTLSYAIQDPCGQPQNGEITFKELCNALLKNVPADEHEERASRYFELISELNDFNKTGVMKKEGQLWKCISAITNARGDTLDEKDIFTRLKKTIAFDRYLKKLAKENPPRTIEDIHCLPGVNVLFFDDVHPSADMHKFMYDEISNSINEEFKLKTPVFDLTLKDVNHPVINPHTGKPYAKDDGDVENKKPLLKIQGILDNKKEWTEAEMITLFLRNYHEKFNDDVSAWGRFGFFRKRNLQWQDYQHTNLEMILKHALNPEKGTGARTREILVTKLGWINKDGQVNPEWAKSNNTSVLEVALGKTLKNLYLPKCQTL